MRFVNINQAKGLKVGQQVFTLDDAGKYGVATLRQRTETEHGAELVFEVPQYFSQDKPAVKGTFVKNITHVAVQKDKNQLNGQEEVKEKDLVE